MSTKKKAQATEVAEVNVKTSDINLHEETVQFTVSMSRLWTRRQVDGSEVEVKAAQEEGGKAHRVKEKKSRTEKVAAPEGEQPDEEMLFVSKDILVSQELQAVSHLDGEVRRYLWSRSFPSKLRRGVYLIPMGLVLDVDAKLKEFADKRTALVEEFLAVYPTKVKDAEKALGALFDVNQYPSVPALRTHFRMTWNMLAQGPPETLKKLKGDVWEKERAKASAQMEEAKQQIVTLMRMEFAKLVDHMVDRLTPDTDGKPKIFKGSMLENMGEFLELFDKKNIVQDQSLAALVKKARGLVKGVDVKALRDDAKFRTQIQKGFADVQKDLGSMVEKRPARRILLEKKENAA